MTLTPPDTNEDTQVNPTHPGGRTIYNAGYGEIMAKSFAAGFALGIGRTLASLIFWGVIFVFSVQLLQPFIEPFMTQLQQLSTFLPQNQFGANQSNLDGLLQQFQPRSNTQVQ